MARKRQTMTELLRKAVADADSLLGIQEATGVKRQALAKFMRGEQSLRLDMADRLAEHFGIECRYVRPERRTADGTKMKSKEIRISKACLRAPILQAIVLSGLLSFSLHAQGVSNEFDLASGATTYINELNDGNWNSSFQGVTPQSGDDFFASANGNFHTVDFLGIGITKVLGGTIAAQPYSVSFFVTTYYPILSGIPFSEFLELRIGGMGGIMQWDQTPTPVQDTVWLQWTGTYTPSPSDVGTPFLFHAIWNERALTAIAIDGPIVAQPIPEPATLALFALAGVQVVLTHRKRNSRK